MNKPSFIPQEETIVFVPEFFPMRESVCVAEEDSTIFLVTRGRVVYELDFQCLKLNDRTLATTGPINAPHWPYCDSGYRISRNGSRMIAFYIRCSERSGTTTRGHAEEHSAVLDNGKTRLELKMFDLDGTADQVQSLELQYADHQCSKLHMHVITFSPDLSIVQVGARIYDLCAPGQPRLWFHNNPLDKPRLGANSSITFSSCNRYLVLTESKYDVAANGSATYGIFRIYRTAGKFRKIAVPGLDNMVPDGFSVAFHPGLPLLMLKYIPRPEPNARDATNYINVIEIDLEAPKPTPIDIPKHEFCPHIR